MIRLEDLRDLKGGFTWLEWEPDAKGGINTIKVGSILFSSPSRELVDQEIGPYVESLRRIFLHLASICRPVHALCGEMRIPGPPALEKARKAVARHTIWAIDWINVFGPPYVEKFGKEFLLGAPAHREEAVEGHLIVYQPTKGFFPWEAAEPSPAAVERYFTSHPDIPWVEYRPWLKQALASGDESPGIRSLARAKDERKGRGLFSRLAGEGKAKVRGKTARWMTVEGLRGVAESTARDARLTLGLELDFSPGSLRVLDEAIDRFFRSKEPLVATTVLSFGAYVGEVVIRSLGGRWQPAAAWDDCAVVDIGPIAEMFPMRRVAKRFEEGEEASLAFWYEAAARAAQG